MHSWRKLFAGDQRDRSRHINSLAGSSSLLTCLGGLVGEELDGQTTGRVCTNVNVEKDARALRRVGHDGERAVSDAMRSSVTVIGLLSHVRAEVNVGHNPPGADHLPFQLTRHQLTQRYASVLSHVGPPAWTLVQASFPVNRHRLQRNTRQRFAKRDTFELPE